MSMFDDYDELAARPAAAGRQMCGGTESGNTATSDDDSSAEESDTTSDDSGYQDKQGNDKHGGLTFALEGKLWGAPPSYHASQQSAAPAPNARRLAPVDRCSSQHRPWQCCVGLIPFRAQGGWQQQSSWQSQAIQPASLTSPTCAAASSTAAAAEARGPRA